MKLKSKIWLEDDAGNKIFGKGIYELLTGVKNLGSVLKAAKSMHMSYNKAHCFIKTLEERLGVKILDTGRYRGHGSALTEAGEDLLIRYRKSMEKVEEDLSETYELYFSDLISK